MIDGFVVLTPILLLAVIALLGFVGCDRVFGLQYVDPPGTPSPVNHVQTVIKSGAAGSNTITADPLSLQGGELIVATVQWGSAAVQQPTPALTGADFAPVLGGGPFAWNGMRVQTFFGTNPSNNQTVTVEAILSGGSNVTWNLCVSAYADVDSHTPIYSPQQSGPIYVGNNPQTPAINIGDGDLVYAVALAADNGGAFPGNNSLAAGPGFTAEFTAIANPLVEDGGKTGPVTAQATITSQGPNPKGFIFAMGIKAATS